MDISDWDRNATILAMARALKRSDLSSALTELRSYIASLPYDIITRKEWMAKKKKEAFYKLLMYVVFSLLNSKVDTEVKSVLGRADVVIKTKNDIYVLELKVDDTVDNALAQIDSKSYAIPYEADGRTITTSESALHPQQNTFHSRWEKRRAGTRKSKGIVISMKLPRKVGDLLNPTGRFPYPKFKWK